jgi:hypothetical protein
MYRLTIILLTLTVFALVAGISSNPSEALCWRVADGWGGFKTPNCKTEGLPDEYALGAIDRAGRVWACLKVGVGRGLLAANCETTGKKEFLWFDVAPIVISPKILVEIAQKGLFTLKGKVSGSTATIECQKLSGTGEVLKGGLEVLGAENGAVETVEFPSLEYSGCSSTQPVKCSVSSVGKAAGDIDTEPVDSEAAQNTAKTKAEQVLHPKLGSTFVKVEYKSSECALNGSVASVEGSLLTEVTSLNSGDGAEQLEQGTIKSEATGKKYINGEGKEAEALGLKIGSVAALLTGEATVEAELSENTLVENSLVSLTAQLLSGKVDFFFEK